MGHVAVYMLFNVGRAEASVSRAWVPATKSTWSSKNEVNLETTTVNEYTEPEYSRAALNNTLYHWRLFRKPTASPRA